MRRAIAADMRLALTGKAFLAGVIGIAVVIFLGQIDSIVNAFRQEQLLEFGFHATLVLESLKSDWMTLALPVLVALPYTASFVDDIKNGFIKEYLPKTTVRGYISGKLAACTVSGGLVPVLGMIAAYGISAAVFSPMEGPLAEDVAAEPYFAQLLASAVLFFLCGAFLSLLGMALAAGTGSKYMAYAAPFILFYVLIILNERYFPDLYVLYPRQWIAPTEIWVMGGFGAGLLVAELAALAGMGFAAAAKRRIANL